MSKKILIINTGGTLSSVMKRNGLIPGLSIYDMQKELQMVSGDTDIEIEDFCSLDSANIFPEDWSAIAQRISDCRNNYDGIVVIHGTDTLAYRGKGAMKFGCFCHFLFNTRKFHSYDIKIAPLWMRTSRR